LKKYNSKAVEEKNSPQPLICIVIVTELDDSVSTLSPLFLGSRKNDVLIKISQSEFAKLFRGNSASILD
jgi:hypothetical protein